MTAISVREFSHHMAKYLKKLRRGEGFILKYRNEPIANLTPTNPAVTTGVPGWRRPFKKIKLKKGSETASETIIRMRREDWR